MDLLTWTFCIRFSQCCTYKVDNVFWMNSLFAFLTNATTILTLKFTNNIFFFKIQHVKVSNMLRKLIKTCGHLS